MKVWELRAALVAMDEDDPVAVRVDGIVTWAEYLKWKQLLAAHGVTFAPGRTGPDRLDVAAVHIHSAYVQLANLVRIRHAIIEGGAVEPGR